MEHGNNITMYFRKNAYCKGAELARLLNYAMILRTIVRKNS